MAISVSGCPLNKLMVLRAFLLAFMTLLLTFSIDLQTAFAHFCRPLLEGAGIFELKHIFLTLLEQMDVLLSPIFSPTLAVAGFLPGLPVFYLLIQIIYLRYILNKKKETLHVLY